jgi:hypothetical protein
MFPPGRYSHAQPLSDPARDPRGRMKKKSVPQTKQIQQEFHFNYERVRVEPSLQPLVKEMPPHKRRAMACVYRRWAHQLDKTADVLEAQLPPWKRRRLPRIEEHQTRLN